MKATQADFTIVYTRLRIDLICPHCGTEARLAWRPTYKTGATVICPACGAGIRLGRSTETKDQGQSDKERSGRQV